jgi:hypothetical protein
MSGKSHLSDTWIRHLEQRSGKEQITANEDHDVKLTERTGVEPERRYVRFYALNFCYLLVLWGHLLSAL